MNNENDTTQIIDISKIVLTLWEHKKLYALVLCIVFVLSSVYIMSLPRTYSTDTKLAPEMNLPNSGVNSLASSLGFNLGNMQTTDAISPQLYPNLLEDNNFLFHILNIHVVSSDKKINTTYYDYICNHQKYPWWRKIFSSKNSSHAGKIRNPYALTKEQNNITEAVRNDISIKVNSKTDVITITAQAQDPLICKILADSARQCLQNFITIYRTNKARIDYDYYKNLATEAKSKYEKVRHEYGSFSDSNTDVVLKSVQNKLNDLENEMQLQYNTYSLITQQMQQAAAKIQERTPAFTIIKGAAQPIKPSAPKRMTFVLTAILLAGILLSIIILRKDFKSVMR